MPGLQRVKMALTGPGSYTPPCVSMRFLAQSGSASADYLTSIYTVPPFVGDIAGGGISGMPVASQPYSNTGIYIAKAAYIQTDTAITGTGASGAGATAKIWRYDSTGAAVGAALFSLAFDSGVNTVALAQLSLGSLVGTVAHATLNAGDSLVFEWLQGGTGLALIAGIVTVDLI